MENRKQVGLTYLENSGENNSEKVLKTSDFTNPIDLNN